MDFSESFDVPDFSDLVLKLEFSREEPGGKRRRTASAREEGRSSKRQREDGSSMVTGGSRTIAAPLSAPPAGQPPSERAAAEPSEEDPDEEAVSKTFYVHRMVMSKSAYFAARLQRWAEKPRGDRMILVERLDKEEVAAAELVIRMMYMGRVPSNVAEDGIQLLQAYRVADRFQVDSLVAKLLKHLAKQAPHGGIGFLREFYRLGPAPASLDAAVSPVGLLESLFGRVGDVLQCGARLGEFVTLPYEAVLAWLRSDQLLVSSENCVLVALTSWINANREACSQEQLGALAADLRVCELSPGYLLTLLPGLAWFRECGACSQHLPLMSMAMQSFWQAPIGQATNGLGDIDHALPPRWRDGPCSWQTSRKLLDDGVLYGGDFSIDVELGSSELWPLLRSGGQTAPRACYFNGVFLKVFVCFEGKLGTPPGVQLGGRGGRGGVHPDQELEWRGAISVGLQVDRDRLEDVLGCELESHAGSVKIRLQVDKCEPVYLIGDARKPESFSALFAPTGRLGPCYGGRALLVPGFNQMLHSMQDGSFEFQGRDLDTCGFKVRVRIPRIGFAGGRGEAYF